VVVSIYFNANISLNRNIKKLEIVGIAKSLKSWQDCYTSRILNFEASHTHIPLPLIGENLACFSLPYFVLISAVCRPCWTRNCIFAEFRKFCQFPFYPSLHRWLGNLAYLACNCEPMVYCSTQNFTLIGASFACFGPETTNWTKFVRLVAPIPTSFHQWGKHLV